MAHFNLWVKKQIYNFSIQSLKRFRFPPVLLLIEFQTTRNFFVILLILYQFFPANLLL